MLLYFIYFTRKANLNLGDIAKSAKKIPFISLLYELKVSTGSVCFFSLKLSSVLQLLGCSTVYCLKQLQVSQIKITAAENTNQEREDHSYTGERRAILPVLVLVQRSQGRALPSLSKYLPEGAALLTSL